MPSDAPTTREETSVPPDDYYDAPTISDVLGDAMTTSLPTDAVAGHLARFHSRLHVGRDVCKLPPPTPLVDGLLFTPGESVVYGPPKVGKTFFALDVALSVATGSAFMGRNVAQGPALYVAAEGVGGLGSRVDTWCQYHAFDDLDAAAFLTTAVNLTDDGAVAALGEIAREFRPALITLDTLARCAVGADENATKDMGLIVGSLDALRDSCDAHVQVVHHSGKDVDKGMRGSSALLGAVDTVLKLTGDPNSVKVENTDQKDAPTAPTWYCKLLPTGGSAVVVTHTAVDDLASRSTVLDALAELPAQDRTATKWQRLAADMGVSERSFWRAKKSLMETGWVTGGDGRGALYVIANEGESDA
jgi:hypothetical protein